MLAKPEYRGDNTKIRSSVKQKFALNIAYPEPPWRVRSFIFELVKKVSYIVTLGKTKLCSFSLKHFMNKTFLGLPFKENQQINFLGGGQLKDSRFFHLKNVNYLTNVVFRFDLSKHIILKIMIFIAKSLTHSG